MASSKQTSQASCNHDSRSGKRSRHLASIIEKLARAGEQAGFRVEEMIEMLNAGVSIGALLDMIGYSLSRRALAFTQQQQRYPPPLPCRAYAGARAGGNNPWIA
jgi:hypothetical protein